MDGRKVKVAMVSACLLGLPTRYDGKSKLYPKVMEFLQKGGYIPVPFCPEQLGGLPTPRPPSEIEGGRGWDEKAKVINEKGEDVTENFIKGAKMSLKIAKIVKPEIIILKSRSPSCGLKEVYDGTFSKRLVNGMGVTAYYLKKEGFYLLTENEVSLF